MNFTVGQLAKLFDLSIRSLHHYDEIGLLSPSERSKAGYRLYSERDVQRLHKIQALRWLDLPLSEVNEILDRDGATIPEVVGRKIAALTLQIEATVDLRTRLEKLHSQHLQGDVAERQRWQNALELFSHYEKHLSADDLTRLQSPSESDVDEWRKAHEDVVSALNRKISPASEEARAIADRWGVLTYKIADGDMGVALRTKSAFESDAGVRRSMSALTNMDPAVIQFVLAASHYAHLRLLAQYLAPEEIERLNFTEQSRAEWLRFVTALRAAYLNRSPIDCEAVQVMAAEWTQQLSVFTNGDDKLNAKLLSALQCDVGLQKRWMVSYDLLDFVQRALEVEEQLNAQRPNTMTIRPRFSICSTT